MAKAAGKGGAGDPGDGAGGMEKAELKRMLKFASDEPVRVAPERAEEEEGDAAAPDGSVPPGQAGAAASRPPGDDAPPTAEGAAAALPGMAPNAAPGRPAASQPAASQPAASQIQPSQPGQAAPAPGGAAKPDTGAMVAQLVPLVQQIQAIAAKDPAQKAPLTKLATEAQASLRRAMLSLTPGDLDQAAATLIDVANKAGGRDNVTVILVRVERAKIE